VSDVRQASREAGVYAYSRVASSVLAALVVVLGARLYGKGDWAYVTLIYTLYETGIALGSLGLADAVFYFLGRNPGGAGAIVRQTSLLLAAVAPLVVGGVAIAGWLLSRPELDATSALPWLAAALLLELPTQPAVNQLIASGRARLGSGLFFGFATLRTAAVVVPAVVGAPVTWIPIALAATSVLRLVTHLAIVRAFYPRAEPGWARADRLREILWFAIPAGAGVLAGRLNPLVDKYAAQLWLTEEQFASYGVAAFELPLVTLVPYAIGAVMQSRYVRLYLAGDVAGLRALWFSTVQKTALITVPLAVALIALGRDAIVLFAGAKYTEAALPFQILTVVLLHRVASYGAMLQSIGQTRAIMTSSALLLATNVVLAYPMTRLFGYPGPAIATVISVVPPWLFTLSRIGRILGGGIRGALPWGFYARVLVLAAVLGVAVWYAAENVEAHPAVRLLGGLAAMITAFIACGRALGLIERDDLRFLGRWLSLRMV
jgi:O-antigen/teichoic acid export membrane protein